MSEPLADPGESPDAESREFDLLNEYLSLLHQGTSRERQQFLTAHPTIAQLAECLDALESFVPVVPDGSPAASHAVTHLDLGGTRLPPGGGDVDLPTSNFGSYELLEEIGRGGMGVIFKAHQPELDRHVALKLILSNHLASAEDIRRFYLEAKAAGGLKHPNIVAIHDVGQVHGQHYFAMDLIDGESLADLLQVGPLDPETSAQCLLSVARAVDHLHRHGVIHRDLKPSNILIDGDGNPFVTDFGLAKLVEGDDDRTRTGTIMGTPAYMAPEQAAGRNSEISVRSDIYSLGAILYEVLTGQPPFREPNPLETLVQVLEGEPPAPRTINSAIPHSLQLICMRCLEKDPQRRYASAAELADDLERFLAHEPVEAQHSGSVVRLQRWIRREPAFASQMGALGVAALIVQVKYTINGSDLGLHIRVMMVFGIWMLAHLLFKYMLKSAANPAFARYAWLGTDVSLLTVILYMAGTAVDAYPLGPLVIGYPLLVIAAGLFTEVKIVWFTTWSSIVAYSVLPVTIPRERVAIHYPIIFCVVLLLVGFIVAYQVNRLCVLRRYCETRREF